MADYSHNPRKIVARVELTTSAPDLEREKAWLEKLVKLNFDKMATVEWYEQCKICDEPPPFHSKSCDDDLVPLKKSNAALVEERYATPKWKGPRQNDERICSHGIYDGRVGVCSWCSEGEG